MVDDRPENLADLELLLGDMGLHLVKALSGSEALRQTTHNDFALVLLDVQMPEMDGFETAELMRKNPRTSSLPILFLTAGMHDDHHRFKGYETGAVDYLMVPDEPAILRSKVRIFCELYRQRRQLERQEEVLRAQVATRTADLSRMAEQLLQSNERYLRLLESITSYVYTVKIENGVPIGAVYKDGCLSVTGFGANEYESDAELWHRIVLPEDRQLVLSMTEQFLAEKKSVSIEYRIVHKDGSLRWITHTRVPLLAADGSLLSFDGIIVDITKHKKLEEQLLQAQKMECVGRLAGGVAHDFNNMLSVIMGSAALALETVPAGNPAQQYLDTILRAADRTSGITRQLLAFSRKNEISPRLVNVNTLINESEKMLSRLISEDVKLSFFPAADIWSVMIDPSQLDQILMNLSVNARDAMPNGGSLVLETAKVHIDDTNHQQYNPDAPTGDYVLMTVSDTGHGMNMETREHIFEPFFTTKRDGEGTGLGLSTVYGIVTQNKGFITVDSTPGLGTVFKIYLPRYLEDAALETKKAEGPLAGAGTILLVEDEEMLLWMTTKLLEVIGYRVIQAGHPYDAIAVCERGDQHIDLILTDVVMPDINGREMVERIRVFRPGIKALFMSGYTADIVTQRGVLEKGMNYIQKPFNAHDLNKKIRKLLA